MSNNQASIDGIRFSNIPFYLHDSLTIMWAIRWLGNERHQTLKFQSHLPINGKKNSKSAKEAGTTGFLPYQIKTMLVTHIT